MESSYQKMKNPEHIGAFKDETFVDMLKSKIFSSISTKIYLIKHVY